MPTRRSRGDDAHLLAAAAEAIERLNRRYGPAPGGSRFLLLHRRRVFNAGENKWMGWERKRGKLHELNRLLRGATDTTFMSIAGDAAAGAGRRPLRHHARCRYQAAARCGAPPDRQDGPSAQSAEIRATTEQRVVDGYGILQPRVTPSLPVGREGSLYQRVFSGPGRHRSLCGGRLRRLSGSVRRRLLYRQGHLRCRRLRGGARRPGAGKHASQPRSLRRHFRARRPRLRCRGGRGIPVPLRCRRQRQHRWTRGDWQLLPWIIGRRTDVRRLPPVGRGKMLDNLRRSLFAPLTLARLRLCWLLPLPAASWEPRLSLPPSRSRRFSPLCSQCCRVGRASVCAAILAALAADLRLAAVQTVLSVAFLPDQAWRMGDAIVADAGAGCFVTRRHLLEWTTAAQSTASPRWIFSASIGRWRAATCSGLRWQFGALALAPCILADRPAVRTALAGGAGYRLVGQPVADASRGVSRFSAGCARPAPHRPAHLALLRDVRHAGRQHAAAGQFPGRPKAGRRAPDIADQYRSLSAVGGRRARLRLGGNDGDRRAAGSDVRYDAEAPAVQGPFLQLVRDAGPARARSGLCVSVDSGNLAGHLIALANACEEWMDEPRCVGGSRRACIDNLRWRARPSMPCRLRTASAACSSPRF